MIKKILLTTLIVLLAGGLLGCYFHFAGALAAEGREKALCDRVEVILLDSLESAIVDKGEMESFLAKAALGRVTARIDLDSIERAIRTRGEVMCADVYTADTRTLAVQISQRKPVIRLENGSRRWYADPQGYLFPVTNAVDVPVVTGHLPLRLAEGYRGAVPDENRDWLLNLVALARYIDEKPVLRSEIAQIDVAANGDLVLYTRTPGPAVIFGESTGYAEKFRKLEAWWRNIAPAADGKPYKTINLKYNNQIICKL